MSNNNEFLGGEFEGQNKPAVTTTTVERAEPAYKRSQPGQFDAINAAKSKTLEEWESRPALDPNAKILCRDDWRRQVELHTQEWEDANGIRRPFHVGQELTIVPGLMEHSLRLGSVYGNHPNYMLTFNPSETLERTVEHIRTHGIASPPNTKPGLPSRSLRGTWTGRLITVGMLPMYEVVVNNIPPVGLLLLLPPQAVYDESFMDGYGHKVQGC